MEETKKLWNLGDGLENVCNSVMRKLNYAGHVLEERNRTIINLDSYEVTAMIHAWMPLPEPPKGGATND